MILIYLSILIVASNLSRNEALTMYVCLCKAVTDHQIKEFVNAGAGSFEDVCKELGVASQCGKCSQLAQNIVESAVKQALFEPAV